VKPFLVEWWREARRRNVQPMPHVHHVDWRVYRGFDEDKVRNALALCRLRGMGY
jgi:hypothetical protein